MTDVPPPDQIPFELFVSLCDAFAKASPKRATQTKSQSKSHESYYVRTLTNWVQHLRAQFSPLPEGAAATFFRFLFPEEDVSRRYNMQETRLAGYIADILGVSTDKDSRGASLRRWGESNRAGCLGAEVRTLMECSSSQQSDIRSMTDISRLLIELASTSAFSSSSVRIPAASRRKPRDILRDLFVSASPKSAAIITQIILKDLRPILYPLKETHYTAQLVQYNQKAVCMLSKEQAFKAWDSNGKLSQAARVCASMEDAVAAFEHPEGFVQPRVGVPVPIPKCIKGKGCKDTLNYLRESSKVWVETKYDGERAQIHVEVDAAGKSKITIFSKSKRDSTMDRYAVHPIIRDALGLRDPSNDEDDPMAAPRIQRNVIVEAEMVAYSDALGKVDEFWRIRSLIASTAVGVRGASYKKVAPTEDCSQSSMVSDASDDGNRRLALVFFDVLMVDDECLLYAPYWKRRARLEGLIKMRPGYAMLVERVPITMHPREDANEALREMFAKLQGEHEEGAVVKADESRYNDWRLRWVKLKADYIPGYGDCVDLVVLGAAWEKERARELLVGPSCYTTFYVGAVSNAATLEADTRPVFQILFTCSYGPSREQLEELNFLIKSSDPVEYSAASGKDALALSYCFVINHGLVPPSVMFHEPLLAEFYGGGFTKAPRSKYYELRWPRMTKIFRARERSWRDGSSLEELQRIARESVGRDRPHKDVDDFCKEIWGKPCSPSVRSSEKRKQREEEWLDKLECVDGHVKVKARKLDFSATSPSKSDQERLESREKRQRKAVTPVKARAFGSVTNLPPTPLIEGNKGRSDEAQLPTPKPTAECPRRIDPPSNDENSAAKIPSVLSTIAQEQAQAHSEPTPIMDTYHGFDGLPTPPASSPPQPQAPIFEPYPTEPCTLREFLRHAAVFLVRDASLTRPRWRAPSSAVVPPGQHLQTLEALLVACGWGGPDDYGCEWAKFGVVFVDDTDRTNAWIDTVQKPLLERRMELMGEGRDLSKPIILLPLTLMHVYTLEDEQVVVERMICRLGSGVSYS